MIAFMRLLTGNFIFMTQDEKPFENTQHSTDNISRYHDSISTNSASRRTLNIYFPRSQEAGIPPLLDEEEEDEGGRLLLLLL